MKGGTAGLGGAGGRLYGNSGSDGLSYTHFANLKARDE
ncbi:hypothetical protein LAUMK191_03399 [Mycobacterium attenuatum]|nr:hypothetical protein LAUMK191_03399 [Mycobacterium attenuatum]